MAFSVVKVVANVSKVPQFLYPHSTMAFSVVKAVSKQSIAVPLSTQHRGI